MTDKFSWYKLDNAAKLYPAISKARQSSTFRISMSLYDNIKADILQQALTLTLKRYPTFDVKLAHGIFWYYFDHNLNLPVVEQEIDPPCSYLDVEKNHGYLFRVLYYNNRISLEVFHSLTDGVGAIEFLKTLVFVYLKIQGADVAPEGLIKLPSDLINQEELEDAFSRYYTSERARSRKEELAYRIKGTSFDNPGTCVVTGTLHMGDLKKLIKEKNATVAAYITTLMIYSIHSSQHSGKHMKEPIKVSVPINLRQIFPSKTLRNFSSFVNVGFRFDQEYSFEEVLASVSEQIKTGATREQLSPWINANVRNERNILLRFVPLFIKNLVIRWVFFKTGENLFSSTMTNLGEVKLPESMMQYVKNVTCYLSASLRSRINCAVCSYKDKINITFSRNIMEADIIRRFFTTLSKQEGLSINMVGNSLGDRI